MAFLHSTQRWLATLILTALVFAIAGCGGGGGGTGGGVGFGDGSGGSDADGTSGPSVTGLVGAANDSSSTSDTTGGTGTGGDTGTGTGTGGDTGTGTGTGDTGTGTGGDTGTGTGTGGDTGTGTGGGDTGTGTGGDTGTPPAGGGSGTVVVTIGFANNDKNINLASPSNATREIWILSSTRFDAVASVCVAGAIPMTFGPTGNENSVVAFGMPEDVNGDGLLDRVVLFNVRAAGFQSGDTSATLNGALTDGTLFSGTIEVHVVGAGNN